MLFSKKLSPHVFALGRLIGFIVLFNSALLMGCVSLHTPQAPPQSFQYWPTQERQAQLNRLRQWQLSGAFSIVRVGQSAQLANYSWLQQGKNDFRIHVFSPLDLFGLTVFGQPGSITLVQSSGQRLKAATPEALLQAAMGWSLPVSNIYYWVRGIAEAGASQQKFDRFGHLVRFRQEGWLIQLSHYRPTTLSKVDLPGKLIMQRPGLLITMVIKKWSILSAHSS